MTWIWISGWGLPPTYVKTVAERHFPQVRHRCLPPTHNLAEQLKDADYTCLLGYSLGAFLILRQAHIFTRKCPRILFAPFIDFRKESEKGGRVYTTQIKFLQRILKNTPLRTINDFYKIAGLDIPQQDHLPYALEDLSWGLEVLLNESVTPESFKGMHGFIGRDDPLLDATVLQTQLPALNTVTQADHCLEPLVLTMKNKSESLSLLSSITHSPIPAKESTLNFNNKAHTYEASALIQRELADWGAQWLEPTLEGKTALEIGAGTGIFTRYLVGRSPSLTATDIASRMVEQGRRTLPQINWQLADGWRIKRGPFDRLYSSSLLQWAKDPVKTLRCWRACLNPRGRLLVLLFIKESLSELHQIDLHLSPVKWRSQTEWETAFIKAGFTILRSEQTTKIYTFASALDLFKRLHSLGATERAQRNPIQLRSVLRNYDARFQTDKGIPSTWTFYRIECGVD